MDDLSPYYKNFEKWGLSPLDIEVELNNRSAGKASVGLLSEYSVEELEEILEQW